MNNGIFRFKVFHRRRAACKTVAVISALSLLALTPVTAFAAPVALTGPADVLANVNGGASISGVTGSMTLDTDLTTANINLTSGGAGLINWSALNIGTGQSLGFSGGNFYNVVGGSDASKIAGQLNASGSLWIFNPAGVSFMSGSQVTVGGLFSVAAAGLENESAIKDAINGGTVIPSPVLAESSAAVSVANGAKFIVGGDMALVGQSVGIESGAKLSEVSSLKIAAGEKVEIDDVGGGKVNLDISQFADVDDDINVTFGGGGVESDINVGNVDHAGDVEVITEGNILINEAIVAKGDVSFRTLAKPASEVVIGHKQMSVASGKLLQGKSVSATAAGRVQVDGDIEAVGDEAGVEIESGLYTGINGSVKAVKDVTVTAQGNINVAGTVESSGGAVTLGADSTIVGSVAATADGGKIVLKSDSMATITVNDGGSITASEITGTGDQTFLIVNDGGTATADSIGLVVNQHGGAVTATTSITGDVNVDGAASTLETAKIDGALTQENGTVAADEVTGAAAVNGGTLTASALGSLEQTGGTVAAKDNSLTVNGTTQQSGGTLGDDNDTITLTGALTQTADGTITADTLNLEADSSVAGKVAATTLDADGTKLTANGDIDATTVKADMLNVTGGTVDATGIEATTLDMDDGKVTADTIAANVDQDGGKVTATTSITGDVDVDGSASELTTAKIVGALTQENGTVAADEVTGAAAVNGGTLTASALGSLEQTGGTVAAKDNSLTVNGTTQQSGGTLGDDNDMITLNGELAQSGDGKIVADTAYLVGGANQTGGAVEIGSLRFVNAGYDVSLSGTENKIGNVHGTVRNLTLVDSEGGIVIGKSGLPESQNSLIVNGNAEITANGGGITQDGKISVAGGDATFKADGDITLDHGWNVFGGKVNADGGNILIAAGANVANMTLGDVKATGDARARVLTGDLTVDGGVDADGNVRIESAAGGVTIGGVVDGNNVTLAAANGIAENAAVNAAADKYVHATGGNINVNATATVGGDVAYVADGATAKIVTDGGVSIGSTGGGMTYKKDSTGTIAATGAVTSKDGVTTFKDATVVAIDTTDSVVVENDGVAVTVGEVAGGVSVTEVLADPSDGPAADGTDTVALDSASASGITAKDVRITVTGDPGDVAVSVEKAIATTDGDVSIATDNGDVNIQADVVATGGDVTVDAGDSIMVDSTGAISGKSVALTANGTGDGKGIQIAGGVSATDGTLDITATGADGISLTGIVTADNGATTLTANNGAISAANADNDFKSVTANAKAVTLKDTDGLDLAGVAVAETLDVTAQSLTDSAANTAKDVVLAVAGDATLDADNDFDTVKGTAANLTLKDVDDITLTQVTATKGDVGVTAGGTITVAGTVSATKDVDGTGNVTLIATADDVVVNGSGSVAADAMAMLDAGGKMRVKGNVTGADVDLDAGDFINVAAGKTVKATSGAVDVEAAGNADVLGSVVADSGSVSVKATGAGKSVRVGGSVAGKTGVTLEGDKSVQVGGDVVSFEGDVALTAKEFVAIDGGTVTADKGTATLKTTDAELLTAGGAAATYSEGQLAGVMVGGASAGAVSAKDVVVESAGSVLVNTGSSVTGADSVTIAANGATEATVATSGITKQGVYVLGGVTATDGDLSVTAAGEGGILATGALVADNGATTLTAANGSIDAQNEDNDFQSLTATAKSVTLNDKEDITLTEVVSSDGDVRVKAMTGNLTVADATTDKVTATGDIRLESSEGEMTIGAGVSGNNVTLSAKGDVVSKKEDGVSNGALSASNGGDLLVESAEGNIVLSADASAADTAALLAEKGGISAVKIDAATAYAKGKGDVKIDSATGKLVTKTDGNIDIEFKDDADHTIAYNAGGYVNVKAKGGLVVDSATPEGADLKVTEVLWPEDTADRTLVDHNVADTQVSGVTAGKEASLESTASSIEVRTGVDAGTTASLNAKADVTVFGTVSGKTGVTVNAGDDVTVDGAVVKAGEFADETTGAVKSGSNANLTIAAGNGVTVLDGATVAATGTAGITASGANGVTVTGTDTKIVADKSLTVQTTTGDGSVVVSEGAYVAARNSVDGNTVTISSEKGSVTVSGATTAVEAGKDLSISGAEGVTVDAAKVGANGSLSIGAAGEDASVNVIGGAKVLAAEDIDIDAKGAVLVDNATVVAKGDILVGDATTRAGSFTAQKGATVTADGNVSVYVNGDAKVDNATVKAGNFTVDANGNVDDAAADYTVGNLTIDAGNAVKVANGAQVGASGTVDVDAGAGGIEVSGASALASNGAMTIDANGGDVKVLGNSTVASGTTLGVGKDGTTKNVTVGKSAADGEDSAQLVAAQNLTIKATEAIVAQNAVKVASDVTTKLDGASVTAQTGAKVLAGADIDIDATGAVTVDAATIAAKGDVLVGETGDATKRSGSFTAQNGAAVTAEKSVSVYVSGDAIVEKGTGDRTEVSGKTGVTLDSQGDIDVDGAVVKAGVIDEATGVVSGEAANLVMSASKSVAVQDAAKIGASGTATVAASGVNNDTDKIGIAVKGEDTQLVSEGNMALSAAAGSIAVADKAYVGTHGEAHLTASNDVEIRDASTKVESSKAMTLSGANVTVDAARVGTSETLGVTATTGDVIVEKNATVIAKGDITVTAKGDTAATPVTGGNVTINASSVTSTAGSVNVGASATRIGGSFTAQNGATVEAAAEAGSVKVYAADGVTLSDTSSVKAGKDAVVDASKAVQIDGDVLAEKGKVDIDAGTTLTVSDDGTVKAKATEGAVDMTAKNAVNVNGEAEIEAGASIDIASTEAGDIMIDTSKGVTANGGNVTIGNDNGKVTIENATVEAKGDSGSVVVAATDGEISVKNATVKSEKKNISIATDGDAGGKVTIDTGVTMTADNYVTIEAKTGVEIKSDVTAKEKFASVNANGGEVAMSAGTTLTAGTDATIEATEGVKLAIVSASKTSGTVSVTTTGGDITDANADENVNVEAQNAVFSAEAGSVGTDTDHVETSVDNIAATSERGVFLTESDGVIVGTVGGVSGLKSTDSGAVVLEATAGDITISQDVEAKGANGNVLIAANNSDGSVTLDATVTAAQNATVTAGKDVEINADIVATAGDAYIEAQNGDVAMKSGTTADGYNVRIAAGSDVKLSQVVAKNVSVKAETGSITDNLDAETANVTATKLRIEAGGDVGEGGASGDNLNTDVANIEVKAGGDSIVSEQDDVTVGGVGDVTAKKVDADGKASGSVADDDLAGIDAGKSATLVSGGKTTVAEKVEAGANVLVQAKSGGIEQNADIAAGQNVSVIADKGNVAQNANITAKKGTIDVEATAGSIAMADGTSAKTANKNIRYRAGGNIAMEKINAGGGSVTLDAGGNLTMASSDAGVMAKGLAIRANAVGTADDKMKFSVSEIAVNSATDVYIDNDESLTVTTAGGDAFKVVRVKTDGGEDSASSAGINGVVAKGGDVDLDVTGGGSLDVASGSSISSAGSTDVDVQGAMSVGGTISGRATSVSAGGGLGVNGSVASGGAMALSAGGDVAFGAGGQVSGTSVSVTAGGDITQDDATVRVNNGMATKTTVHAAINASGEATLAAGGGIGRAGGGTSDYVGVKAGSVSASADNGGIAIAGADGSDINVGPDGISASGKVALYTSGTVHSNGKAVSGSSVSVTAKDFSGGNVLVNVGGQISVNNLNRGRTLLAMFTTRGGNANPYVNNQPNNAVLFVDGRLAGGDLQTINKFGALEAFPVQTPELKSEQGIFGNPVFLHDELGVANPLAVGAIDFLLLDIPRLTLSSDFPIEVEKQVAATGLSPTTSYWFGQKGNDEQKKESEGKSGEDNPADEGGDGGEPPVSGNLTAKN